jgi:polyisoprenoid-binding protein YceI
MKFVSLVLTLCALLLTACVGGDAPATTPTAPAAAAPTEAPTEPAAQAPTEAPTAPAEAAPTEPAEAPTEPAEAPTEPAEAAPTEPAEAPTAPAAEEAPADSMQRFVIVPDESMVMYAVDEVFLSEGVVEATAVGITRQIEGEILYDMQNPQNSEIGTITIDISAFQSDEERRDNAIRERWLESASYPLATFEPTEIQGLPESYTPGEEINLQITGDLTVRDVTNQVTFDTTGFIEDDKMQGIATTQILMTDYGFEPPDIANILRAENEVDITFEFVARPPDS